MISGIWMKCPHWNVFFLIIKKSRQNMVNVSEHGRQLEQEESGCWWNRTSVACKTSLSVCVCVHMYFLSLQPPREKLSTGFTRRKAAITTEQFFFQIYILFVQDGDRRETFKNKADERCWFFSFLLSISKPRPRQAAEVPIHSANICPAAA